MYRQLRLGVKKTENEDSLSNHFIVRADSLRSVLVFWAASQETICQL